MRETIIQKISELSHKIFRLDKKEIPSYLFFLQQDNG